MILLIVFRQMHFSINKLYVSCLVYSLFLFDFIFYIQLHVIYRHFFVSIESKILNCKPCNSMFLFQLLNCQNWFHLSLFSNQYEYMWLEEDRYCFMDFPAQNFFGSIKYRHTFEATAVLVEFHSNEWEIDGYMCVVMRLNCLKCAYNN